VDSTHGKFGPFSGQLLVGEMNKGRIMRVALEEVKGTLQGMCIPFYDGAGLQRGNNRLAFGPDNRLWVGHSSHGWAGDKGLQRITWNGKTPPEVHSMKITPKGFELTFTTNVEKALATDPSNYAFQRYFYSYHQGYGSPQREVEKLDVKETKWLGDRKVSLVIGEMKPDRVYELRFNSKLGLVNNLVFYNAVKLP